MSAYRKLIRFREFGSRYGCEAPRSVIPVRAGIQSTRVRRQTTTPCHPRGGGDPCRCRVRLNSTFENFDSSRCQTVMDNPDKLVLRANRLYHDLEAGRYADEHPEIFRYKPERWQRTARTDRELPT